MKLRTLVLTGALLASPFCGAAFAQGSGFYAGAAYGISHYGLSTTVATDQGARPNQTDASSTGWTGTLGWKLNDTWALEAVYLDPGKAVIRGLGPTTNPGTFSIRVHRINYGIGLAYSKPLNDKWGFTARGGAHQWNISYDTKGSILPVADDDGKDIYAGVGLAYNFNEKFSVNLGLDYYWGGDSQSVSMYSIGGKLKF